MGEKSSSLNTCLSRARRCKHASKQSDHLVTELLSSRVEIGYVHAVLLCRRVFLHRLAIRRLAHAGRAHDQLAVRRHRPSATVQSVSCLPGF